MPRRAPSTLGRRWQRRRRGAFAVQPDAPAGFAGGGVVGGGCRAVNLRTGIMFVLKLGSVGWVRPWLLVFVLDFVVMSELLQNGKT